MTRALFKSPSYRVRAITDRYAANINGEYHVYEMANGKLMREYVVPRRDLSDRIADECDRWKSNAYNKVRMEK